MRKITKKTISAREFATILNVNPYETSWELLERKIEKKHPFFGNIFTDHGKAFEETALNLYKKVSNNNIRPHTGLVKHPKYDWITGIPDAITENNCLVEVKCPYNKDFKELQNVTDVPLHYWIQCQVYMEILNIECCHYTELYILPGSRKDGSQGNITFIPITRDRKWWKDSLPKIIEYKKEMDLWVEKGNLNEHPIRMEENKWVDKLLNIDSNLN
jgi:putative phage-type endonuclease